MILHHWGMGNFILNAVVTEMPVFGVVRGREPSVLYHNKTTQPNETGPQCFGTASSSKHTLKAKGLSPMLICDAYSRSHFHPSEKPKISHFYSFRLPFTSIIQLLLTLLSYHTSQLNLPTFSTFPKAEKSSPYIELFHYPQAPIAEWLTFPPHRPSQPQPHTALTQPNPNQTKQFHHIAHNKHSVS